MLTSATQSIGDVADCGRYVRALLLVLVTVLTYAIATGSATELELLLDVTFFTGHMR